MFLVECGTSYWFPLYVSGDVAERKIQILELVHARRVTPPDGRRP